MDTSTIYLQIQSELKIHQREYERLENLLNVIHSKISTLEQHSAKTDIIHDYLNKHANDNITKLEKIKEDLDQLKSDISRINQIITQLDTARIKAVNSDKLQNTAISDCKRTCADLSRKIENIEKEVTSILEKLTPIHHFNITIKQLIIWIGGLTALVGGGLTLIINFTSVFGK